jgi:DNA-binding MarR family transcriptional regulator
MPFVEMLFFAYRDFTGEADAALAAYGLGRAHHRVLHFVNRHPAIRVADLLELLKITKQSLSRVLRRLVADGWIEHVPGPEDRRERHLTLTQRGRKLATELAALQTQRIHTALGAIDGPDGAQAHDTIRQFLLALIAENDRAEVAELVGGGVPSPAARNPGGA